MEGLVELQEALRQSELENQRLASENEELRYKLRVTDQGANGGIVQSPSYHTTLSYLRTCPIHAGLGVPIIDPMHYMAWCEGQRPAVASNLYLGRRLVTHTKEDLGTLLGGGLMDEDGPFEGGLAQTFSQGQLDALGGGTDEEACKMRIRVLSNNIALADRFRGVLATWRQGKLTPIIFRNMMYQAGPSIFVTGMFFLVVAQMAPDPETVSEELSTQPRLRMKQLLTRDGAPRLCMMMHMECDVPPQDPRLSAGAQRDHTSLQHSCAMVTTIYCEDGRIHFQNAASLARLGAHGSDHLLDLAQPLARDQGTEEGTGHEPFHYLIELLGSQAALDAAELVMARRGTFRDCVHVSSPRLLAWMELPPYAKVYHEVSVTKYKDGVTKQFMYAVSELDVTSTAEVQSQVQEVEDQQRALLANILPQQVIDVLLEEPKPSSGNQAEPRTPAPQKLPSLSNLFSLPRVVPYGVPPSASPSRSLEVLVRKSSCSSPLASASRLSRMGGPSLDLPSFDSSAHASATFAHLMKRTDASEPVSQEVLMDRLPLTTLREAVTDRPTGGTDPSTSSDVATALADANSQDAHQSLEAVWRSVQARSQGSGTVISDGASRPSSGTEGVCDTNAVANFVSRLSSGTEGVRDGSVAAINFVSRLPSGSEGNRDGNAANINFLSRLSSGTSNRSLPSVLLRKSNHSQASPLLQLGLQNSWSASTGISEPFPQTHLLPRGASLGAPWAGPTELVPLGSGFLLRKPSHDRSPPQTTGAGGAISATSLPVRQCSLEGSTAALPPSEPSAPTTGASLWDPASVAHPVRCSPSRVPLQGTESLQRPSQTQHISMDGTNDLIQDLAEDPSVLTIGTSGGGGSSDGSRGSRGSGAGRNGNAGGCTETGGIASIGAASNSCVLGLYGGDNQGAHEGSQGTRGGATIGGRGPSAFSQGTEGDSGRSSMDGHPLTPGFPGADTDDPASLHDLYVRSSSGGQLLGGDGTSMCGESATPRISSANIRLLSTYHRSVSVLFTNVEDFTSMSQTLHPSAVMLFLNQLFSLFDALLEEHDVYKVETIGDCYMVASGLFARDRSRQRDRSQLAHTEAQQQQQQQQQPERDSADTAGSGRKGGARQRTGEPRQRRVLAITNVLGGFDPDHATKMMRFAKALVRVAGGMLSPWGQPVRIRVGVHCGPLVTGVVGRRMPRFCCFGDTVNTASRMQTTGAEGLIHASAAFRSLTLEEDWQYTGGVDVKGKGIMDTYTHRPTTKTKTTQLPDKAP